MLNLVHQLAVELPAHGWLLAHGDQLKIVVAGFLVAIVVGITGMGGGALMTPALLFLGVGAASSVVTADLTASAVYKSGGALVHWREGSPNLRLAAWLMTGSVPMALVGPHLVRWVAPGADVETVLQLAIGFALLLAMSTFVLRRYLELRRRRRGEQQGPADRHLEQVLRRGLVVGEERQDVRAEERERHRAEDKPLRQ